MQAKQSGYQLRLHDILKVGRIALQVTALRTGEEDS